MRNITSTTIGLLVASTLLVACGTSIVTSPTSTTSGAGGDATTAGSGGSTTTSGSGGGLTITTTGSGGPMPEAPVVALNQLNPAHLAIDDKRVYWTNSGSLDGNPNQYDDGNGSVMAVPLAGGEPVVLAAQYNTPEFIAVDEDDVYWSTWGNGGVFKVPKSGGAPTQLFEGKTVGELVLDGADIYFTVSSQAHVRRMSKTGGDSTVIFIGNAGNEALYTFAVDDEDVYVYASSVDGESKIHKVPKAGGTAVIVASGLARVGTMVLSGPYLYVTEGGTEQNGWHDGIIWRMAKTGGPPEILADGQGNPKRSVLGGSALYWLNGRAPGAGIVRRDNVGGALTMPWTTGGSDLALGAGSLCWTEPNSDPNLGKVLCMMPP